MGCGAFFGISFWLKFESTISHVQPLGVKLQKSLSEGFLKEFSHEKTNSINENSNEHLRIVIFMLIYIIE